MAKAVAQGWGLALAELRRACRLTASEVVKRLTAFGIEIDPASIYTYEAGKVYAPDAGVVWGLAQVYGVSVTDLIADLVADRSEGRSLEGHKASSRDQARSSTLSDTEANVIQLWRQLPAHKRKACEEFMRFQLQDEPGRAARRGPRRSARAK
jgi:transcriptional regulator with XRE-family HTH domain